jgi:GH15 family glucan-1,4-alpha-glucosidase
MPAPLEDYALLGDMHSAALVQRNGSLDWLCLPRFDGAAVFAALLGSEENGSWRLAPEGAGRATRRRYLPDTLILESEWDTPTGTVRITDFMPPRDEVPNVIRIVEGVSGTVAVRSTIRFRFDYGRSVPWVRHLPNEISAMAGPDAVSLCAIGRDLSFRGRNFASYADFEVSAGERVGFVLTWHPSHEPAPDHDIPDEALRATREFWTSWVAQGSYDGPYRDAVVRSLITLKALIYQPTGGIVAAPTTSLPEDLGGVRNWDYRFCWLRDATLTLEALLRSGYTDEAEAWRQWLLRAIAGSPEELQILYGLAGERRLPEYDMPWLAGYENSKPVRCGNAAAAQRQLDVYGEVMNALALARTSELGSNPESWNLQIALLEWLEAHWHEPDEGLWEVRGGQRHFVHSKVLAWVAFDRAITAVETTGRSIRQDIFDDVLDRGYDADRGTFTQYYGGETLDAATLLMPGVGFLPADDPRVVGTVEAVQRELVQDGFLMRYGGGGRDQSDVDGLPGSEGAFLACSFWLVDALSQLGRHDEATAMYERLLGLTNDLGLLAEEYDPRYGRQVGNFPQAFTHLALVNTAFRLRDGAVPGSS